MMFGFNPKWTLDRSVDSSNLAATELANTLQRSRENAISSMENTTRIMKTYYDERRDDLPEYKVGQMVWLDRKNIKPFRPMKKLAEKRYGPFKITDHVPPSSYHLALPSTWKGLHLVFNEVLLIPALTPLKSQTTLRSPLDVQPDEIKHYKVKAIHNSRKRRKCQFYLVKWAGYGPEEMTWEPLSNLKDAKEALADYRSKRSR
jgi:hypothetical protein